MGIETGTAMLISSAVAAASAGASIHNANEQASKSRKQASEQQEAQKRASQVEQEKLNKQNKQIQDNALRQQEAQSGLVNSLDDDEDDDLTGNNNPFQNNFI